MSESVTAKRQHPAILIDKPNLHIRCQSPNL